MPTDTIEYKHILNHTVATSDSSSYGYTWRNDWSDNTWSNTDWAYRVAPKPTEADLAPWKITYPPVLVPITPPYTIPWTPIEPHTEEDPWQWDRDHEYVPVPQPTGGPHGGGPRSPRVPTTGDSGSTPRPVEIPPHQIPNTAPSPQVAEAAEKVPQTGEPSDPQGNNKGSPAPKRRNIIRD